MCLGLLNSMGLNHLKLSSLFPGKKTRLSAGFKFHSNIKVLANLGAPLTLQVTLIHDFQRRIHLEKIRIHIFHSSKNSTKNFHLRCYECFYQDLTKTISRGIFWLLL
jgi:hypothetical protein